MTQKFITICFVAILTFVSFGMSAFGSDKIFSTDDVYKIDGVLFKKFTTEPLNGSIHYLRKKYSDGKPYLEIVERYSEGKISSIETYCDNGALISVKKMSWIAKDFIDYKEANGAHKEYYCDGTLKRVYEIKDGKRVGEGFDYQTNGKLRRKDIYKDGVPNRTTFEYSMPLGILVSETNYLNGKIDGIYRKFHQNGSIRSEMTAKNGHWDGLWKYYDLNGNLTHTELYKNGNQLHPLTITFVEKYFPLCFVLSSKGQFCKSLTAVERDTLSFRNRLKVSNKAVWKGFVRDKDRVNKSLQLTKRALYESWRYRLDVIEVDSKTQIKFTDESLTSTYYTVVTYDLEFNKDKRNWFLVGSVVEDIRGSEDDRKVIGQYRQYDPPIPFLEMRPD